MPRRRRRIRRSHAEVELNLASMLDMAFQLLAFFILTFRPSPIEGQISLHLPPPLPATDVSALPADADSVDGMPAVDSLIITVLADRHGRVSSVRVSAWNSFVGPASPTNLLKLDRQLRDLLGMRGTPYGQVLIRVAPTLRYEELMKIIDVCTRQKPPDGNPLQKISFVELPDSSAESE